DLEDARKPIPAYLFAELKKLAPWGGTVELARRVSPNEARVEILLSSGESAAVAVIQVNYFDGKWTTKESKVIYRSTFPDKDRQDLEFELERLMQAFDRISDK